MAKKCLKWTGICIGVVLLCAIALLLWLTIAEYKPAAVEEVEVGDVCPGVNEIYAEGTPLSVGDSLTVLSLNTGYGGLGKEADFFMDGGKDVAPTREQSDTNRNGLAAQLADARGGLLGVPVLVVVGDGHLGALLYEGVGYRPADTAVSAGNEGHAPGQLGTGRSALRDGAGVHLVFQAGLAVLVLGRKGPRRSPVNGAGLVIHKNPSFHPFYGGREKGVRGGLRLWCSGAASTLGRRILPGTLSFFPDVFPCGSTCGSARSAQNKSHKKVAKNRKNPPKPHSFGGPMEHPDNLDICQKF